MVWLTVGDGRLCLNFQLWTGGGAVASPEHGKTRAGAWAGVASARSGAHRGPGSRPHRLVPLAVPFRLHLAVCHLLQRRALLLRLLLPVPHLRHPHHHHPAGAFQEPELQQKLRREERGAPAVDQRAAPQLLPHLPGAPCAQHSPGSHRLRGPQRTLAAGSSGAPLRCPSPCDRTADSTRTPERPHRRLPAWSSVHSPRQSQRQAASRWPSGLVSCFPEMSSPRGVRFLVFVFGDIASSSRCHIYSLVYIVFSDRCSGGSPPL